MSVRCRVGMLSRLVSVLAPFKHQIDAVLVSVSARAVEAGQHRVEGARSAVAWVASKTGVSERAARERLVLHEQLSSLPEVSAALSSGSISLEQASVIGRAASGDASVARSLLGVARSGSFCELQRSAQGHQARIAGGSRRERLRRTQYVRVRRSGDGLVTGEFRLAPNSADTRTDHAGGARVPTPTGTALRR